MAGLFMKVDSRLKFVNVSCYSGYKSDERPISFTLRKRTLIIEEILDRWYGPNNSYFKVLADDKKIYLIKRNLDDDLWTVEKIMHSYLFSH